VQLRDRRARRWFRKLAAHVCPPAISTLPFPSRTSVSISRGVDRLPVAQNPLTVNGLETAVTVPAVAASV